MKRKVSMLLALFLALAFCMSVASAPIKISFGTWKPEMVKYFEDPKNQPPDIASKNIVVTADYAPTDQYLGKVLADIAAGTAPDIPLMPLGPMWVKASPYFIDLAPYAEKDWGKNWRNRFNPLGFKLVNKFKGTLGIPWGLVGMTMINYNIDLFEKLGIKYPKTLDELEAASKILRDHGYQPVTFGYNDKGATLSLFKTIVGDFDPAIWDKAEFTGEAAWTDPAFLKALNIYKELFDRHILADNFLSANLYMDSIDPFRNGSAGMVFNGIWTGNFLADPTFRNAIKFRVGYGYLPDLNGDGKAPNVYVAPDFAISISDSCKNPKAAWEVVKSLAVGDVGKQMYDALTGFPIIDYKPKLDWVTSANKQTVDNARAVLADMVKKSNASISGYLCLNPQIQETLWVGIADLFNGVRTAEEVLQEVEKVAKETRGDFRYLAQ